MRTWTRETNRTTGRAAVDPRERNRLSESSAGLGRPEIVEEPTVRRRRLTIHDPMMAALAGVATLFGLVFVFDAGYARSLQTGRGMIPREFWSQLFFTAIAAGVGLLAARIPIDAWRRMARPIWILTLAALGALMVRGVGHEMNGAVRWFRLGPITIQPAEFAKVSVVLYLAAALAYRKAWPAKLKVPENWALRIDSITIPKLKRALPLVWVGVALAMIELEPDLGTGFIVAFTAFAVLWAGGVTRRSLGWCMALAAVALLLVLQLQPYRLDRFSVHADRWNPANVDGTAYQTVQSELAMASGGMVGVGMGLGRAKYVMPAATTDFISATVAEEFGLIGWLAVAGTLGALSWRMLRRAADAPHPFGRLALFGFGVWIGGQTILNLMMANGTLPAIGVPLPFVSSGGSSLVALWIAIGIGQAALAPMPTSEEVPDAARGDGRRDGRPRLSRA